MYDSQRYVQLSYRESISSKTSKSSAENQNTLAKCILLGEMREAKKGQTTESGDDDLKVLC